ncbi:MAG: tRNA (guanosine(46)-N7)-methyltransferase TrmB [Pseudohongiellaceae bacterium]|nr:tRNA (guanosine(46)-N7)-methyltransferase TrmB [Pseudohongiellaceae bacterium]
MGRDTKAPDNVENPRGIRSYVIRGGRLTAAQEYALEHFWPKYGIDDTQSEQDLTSLFPKQAPIVMEIGFGMGDSLLEMAKTNPDKNFIGIEVHRPGVGKLLHEIAANELSNLRIWCHDAKEILARCIPDQSLAAVQIFFPDPWHKKKHNKRRIVQLPFMALIATKLSAGGYVHMATDWVPYAEHMMEVLSAAKDYENAAGEGQYSLDTQRPITKFEKRGHRLGHEVHDLIFKKIN